LSFGTTQMADVWRRTDRVTQFFLENVIACGWPSEDVCFFTGCLKTVLFKGTQ
jgi:hypothetical protein